MSAYNDTKLSACACRLVGTLIACGFLWGCQPAAKAPAFGLTREQWKFGDVAGQKLQTDHFDLYVTLTDDLMTEVLPRFLETCHKRYVEVLGDRPADEGRLTTYVFDTRPQWWEFTEKFSPNELGTYQYIANGGYTDQATATAVLWWIGRDNTLAIVAHEGLHQYVARHLREPIPAWLNEGLATQMEAFELNDGVPKFNPRQNFFRRNYLKDALVEQSRGLYALPEFLNMHAGQAVASPLKSTSTYYAQAWALVLFLMEGPNKKYCEGFRMLLQDAGTPALPTAAKAYAVASPESASLGFGEQVFRRYIAEDYDGFMAEYTAFARELVRIGRRNGEIPW